MPRPPPPPRRKRRSSSGCATPPSRAASMLSSALRPWTRHPRPPPRSSASRPLVREGGQRANSAETRISNSHRSLHYEAHSSTEHFRSTSFHASAAHILPIRAEKNACRPMSADFAQCRPRWARFGPTSVDIGQFWPTLGQIWRDLGHLLCKSGNNWPTPGQIRSTPAEFGSILQAVNRADVGEPSGGSRTPTALPSSTSSHVASRCHALRLVTYMRVVRHKLSATPCQRWEMSIGERRGWSRGGHQRGKLAFAAAMLRAPHPLRFRDPRSA